MCNICVKDDNANGNIRGGIIMLNVKYELKNYEIRFYHQMDYETKGSYLISLF